jgi:hypothetical protein
MVAAVSTRKYQGEVLVALRRRSMKPKGWRVRSRATGVGSVAARRNQASVNIAARISEFPELKRLLETDSKLSCALRYRNGVDAHGWPTYAQPTHAMFVADPGFYILELLDRISDLFVCPKWGGGANKCLRFDMKYQAYVPSPTPGVDPTDPCGLDNLCLPTVIPAKHQPREGRRKIRKERRHYCHLPHNVEFEEIPKGYMKIYLGQDKGHKPISEYLHRLVMLAFNGCMPDANKYLGRLRNLPLDKVGTVEVSHACGHAWCANVWHMSWVSRGENVRNDPYTNEDNQGNVGTQQEDNLHVGGG